MKDIKIEEVTEFDSYLSSSASFEMNLLLANSSFLKGVKSHEAEKLNVSLIDLHFGRDVRNA